MNEDLDEYSQKWKKKNLGFLDNPSLVGDDCNAFVWNNVILTYSWLKILIKTVVVFGLKAHI